MTSISEALTTVLANWRVSVIVLVADRRCSTNYNNPIWRYFRPVLCVCWN